MTPFKGLRSRLSARSVLQNTCGLLRSPLATRTSALLLRASCPERTSRPAFSVGQNDQLILAKCQLDTLPTPPIKENLSVFLRTCVHAPQGFQRGYAPWHTDFGTKSSVLDLARGVHALPVRTYTAIAPNASYRVTTKFAQSELDSAKQKAGYHYHSDTLPLLVYRSE